VLVRNSLMHIFFWLSFGVVFADLAFTDRTGVLPIEPSRNTLLVEAVQTRQDDVLVSDLVVALADCATFVFFAEIHIICLCVLRNRQRVQHLLRHWVYQIYVQFQQVLVLRVLFI